MRMIQSHRTALYYKEECYYKGERQKHVNQHPPHVHVEVAEGGVAAQGTDNPGQCAEADGCRYKHIADAKENLAEVR